MARLIRSLLIDDVLRTDAIQSFDGWVEVAQIRDCQDAQVQLTKCRNAPIDLLLLDVDLSESNGCFPDYFHWSSHQNNSPFCGPLLALPFLGCSPVVVVEQYSSYWDNLRREGYPLAALSMIRSVTERKYVSPSDVSDSIPAKNAEHKMLAEFSAALRSALRRFRGTLDDRTESGDVEFLDMLNTIKQMKRICKVAKDERTTIAVPFATDSEAVAVKYVSSHDDAVNSIAVHSLFTDLLLSGDDEQDCVDIAVSVQRVDQIINELAKWKKYDHPLRKDLVDVAFQAMKKFEEGMEAGQVLKIADVVDTYVKPTSDDIGDSKLFTRRLVLVLAWVHAWHVVGDDPDDVEALERQKDVRKRYVHSLLCLGDSASTQYIRILGTTKFRSEWRLPFFPDEEDKQQSYSLNSGDKAAMLTPYLKMLARKYAVERFVWDGPYPEWMI